MEPPGGFFFFSGRRRHTRYWRDWSSDVCSSDLPRSRSWRRPGRARRRDGCKSGGGSMTQLVDAPRDVAEDPAPPRAGRSRALLGLVPFVLYLLVFLGGPLYFVISGALSDPDGRPTLDNVVAALTEPQYRVA